MSKQHFAALAMTDRATFQITADRHPNHHRALERIVRAPANQWHLVAKLMICRPDVIKELNLGNRLQPAHRKPHRLADDVRFGKRRVEDPSVSESPLQVEGDFENTSLPFDLFEILLAA